MPASERWSTKARDEAFDIMCQQSPTQWIGGVVSRRVAQVAFNWCWSFCYRMVLEGFSNAAKQDHFPR